jgi:hypothetical protein
MATFSSQLIEFLGSELQSSGPCHKDFLIDIGSNNFLKPTNVYRNEPIVTQMVQNSATRLSFWN